MSLASSLIFTVLAASGGVSGNASGSAAGIKAPDAKLSADPQWLKLIHFTGGVFSHSPGHSDVITDKFFLSPDGAHDPKAELTATISAMQAAPRIDASAEDLNTHAQCRFPARFIWLKQAGAFAGIEVHEVKCAAFEEFVGKEKPTGASLIFASGHMENPASFYGHMLLRFDTAEARPTDPAALLQTTLNYGAVYPESENGVVYILKGLSGGYQSTFTDLSFFNHQFRYNESQLRDAWVYELNLDQQQTDLLVAHAWEMMGAYNRYYFLRQNCAYRIAELISVVIDTSLIPSKPWVAPVDVLRTAVEAQNDGKPLVRKVERLSSRRSEFVEKFTRLNTGQRHILTGYVSKPAAPIDTQIAGLSPREQSELIEVLLDYYAIAENEKGGDHTEVRARKNQLLLARMQRPPGPVAGKNTDPTPPHEGQRSSLLGLSYIHNSELGSGVQLRLRGAYNDFLSLAPAALPWSELAFVDARAEIIDGDISLRSLDAIRLTSLNVSQTGLPDDGGMAWRLRIGGEQESLACNGCFLGYVEGGYGKAAQLSDGLVAYAFANGRMQGPDTVDGVFHAGLSAGLVLKGDSPLRAHAEIGAWQDLDGDGDLASFAKAELRYGNADPWEGTLSVQYEDSAFGAATVFNAGLVLYW